MVKRSDGRIDGVVKLQVVSITLRFGLMLENIYMVVLVAAEDQFSNLYGIIISFLTLLYPLFNQLLGAWLVEAVHL